MKLNCQNKVSHLNKNKHENVLSLDKNLVDNEYISNKNKINLTDDIFRCSTELSYNSIVFYYIVQQH